MIDLTPIFQAIIALLAALVTYKLVPWIKARTSTEQQRLLHAVTTTLVFAAEQIYGAGRGPEKFEFVQAELQKRGFTVDKELIEATIKEYMQELHSKKTAEDVNPDETATE